MFDEVLSSNPPDLPVSIEGEYVWHMEVIVVVVEIDPMSHNYENAQLSILPNTKKKKKKKKHTLEHIIKSFILP
jgi:hypothetical protein